MSASAHAIHDQAIRDESQAPAWNRDKSAPPSYMMSSIYDEDFEEPTVAEIIIVGVVLVGVMTSPLIITGVALKLAIDRIRRR